MQRFCDARHAAAGASARALEASWRRVSRAFPALEAAFFARREAEAAGQGRSHHHAQPDLSGGVPSSPAVFPSSELGFALEDYGGGQPGPGILGSEAPDHLSAFSSDLSQFLRFSRLKARSIAHVVQQNVLTHSRYVLCFLRADGRMVISGDGK